MNRKPQKHEKVDRNKDIIEMRRAFPHWSFAKLGTYFHISRQRCHQIVSRQDMGIGAGEKRNDDRKGSN